MKFRNIETPTGGGQSGGLFVKIKEGAPVSGVLRGEIYEFKQVWENGKSKVVSDDHPDGKTKFRANFIVNEDGKFQAKILEFGVMLYQQFATIADDYDIETTSIKITRTGQGTDTTYQATPLPPKSQPTPANLKAMEALTLNILEHKDAPVKEIKNYAPQATGTDDPEGLPF
jgi:hypothetical protein